MRRGRPSDCAPQAGPLTRAEAAGRRLRVLMLSGEYPPQAGGVADYTARLVDGLRALGHQVSVLTGRPQEPGCANGPTVRVREWGFQAWPPIEAAIAKLRPDVLHIQYQAGAYGLKGAVNMLPLWLRRRAGGPGLVTTLHDLRVPYLFPRAGRLRQLAMEILMRGSHAAIFVDPADLVKAGPGAGRRWIPVASNIPRTLPRDFDRAAARRALGVTENDLLIGYFGFLTASKGAHTLLTAFRQLLDDGRSVRLALIGAAAGTSNPTDLADEVEVAALARSLGLEPHIELTGYLPPSQVSAKLIACDMLALPYVDGASFRRGSLLAGLEHGLPIVTTVPHSSAYGSGKRTFVPGRHFLAVPPNDPFALAKAIRQLADDPLLRANLGSEARALAAECDWKAIAAETAEVYVECLGSRASRPSRDIRAPGV
jgi:polysaccharide biosynthesis protein PslF